MIILVYLDDNKNILRVGLYEKATLKWLKWLPKKKYKEIAIVQNLEVKVIESDNDLLKPKTRCFLDDHCN